MAAVHSNNTVQASPQKMDHQQHSQRFQNRVYQPYVFQPNFLKQQIRQRELEKAVQLSEGSSAIQLTLRDRNNAAGGSLPLPQNVIDEMMNRKKTGRKVIDWTPSCALYLEKRRWQREFEDVPSLLPDPTFSIEMQAIMAYRNSSASSVATKFVRSATNKMKCPVYKVVWTPDGRRLVTGSASGEFTLWNGTAFNFETILQAHDSPVRAMSWSRNDAWLITGDNQGYIKYWQLNMNNVKMYQAHKDQACRSVCFGPTDSKFVTASDDGTVRVWDFLRCHEEHILRGHGADVKQVDWHPQKCLIASASKDLQTPVKLWDPRAGQSLATIHAHKGTVMDIKFNRNGNWFLTASRDHLIKLYDIRQLKEERQVFRGHKKEAFSVAWHPIHEDMFASGGSEGSIMYWQVGEDKEVGHLEGAHDSLIWSLAWHPLGHILVSGSNDHSTKFWTRNRPGDQMKDRYNLGTGTEDGSSSKATAASNTDKAEATSIPGMGDTAAAEADVAKREEEQQKSGIPGLDWSFEEKNEFERKLMTQHDNRKKIPYARPVPRSFAAAWESKKEGAPPRRYSRSPSPRRFDDHWHGDIPPPPRFHHPPPPEEDYHVIDERRPPPEHDRPPHAMEERLPPPPFDPPPTGGIPPPHNDEGPIDYDQNHFPEGPNISNPVHGDDSFEQTHMDVEPYQEFGMETNHHNHERPFPPPGRGNFRPFRGRPVPRRQGPPGRRDWNPRMPEDDVHEEDFLLKAEELYGPEYAELLAMDNLDETLLANYELEREALGIPETNHDIHAPPQPRNLPPRPPRGMFRGRPGLRGRGVIRPKGPVPLMSLGFDQRGRGAPRRMRRGRRPMM